MSDREAPGDPNREQPTQPLDPDWPYDERHRPRSAGENAARFVRATGLGARAVARGSARATRSTLRAARRASTAQGAGASGLSRLIEVHAVNTAGDAAVAIALANTLFFAGATSEARSQVALFLGLTMLPFAIVAPLIGPFLDRFSHGRRWAIGATMAIRAFLCWILASAVATESTWLFPAALGVLVSSKAYGITKAAAAPRLKPEGFTLVKANARISLSGVVGATACAPVAGLLSMAGPEWVLRFGFGLFVCATILAILLPAKVDSSVGEVRLELMPGPSARDEAAAGPARRVSTGIPRQVAFALRAMCGPKFLVGFLTMFMAFLLREHPIDGWEERPEFLLGIVIGAAGLGNTVGVALASILRRINPAITVVAVLVVDAAMVLTAALMYGFVTLVALGLCAGMCQSLGKLSLDSTIQVHVHEKVQTSAFGRADTLLQFAWVVGGFVGVAMPLNPRLGLGIAFVVLSAWTVFVLGDRIRKRMARPPAPASTQTVPPA